MFCFRCASEWWFESLVISIQSNGETNQIEPVLLLNKIKAEEEEDTVMGNMPAPLLGWQKLKKQRTTNLEPQVVIPAWYFDENLRAYSGL